MWLKRVRGEQRQPALQKLSSDREDSGRVLPGGGRGHCFSNGRALMGKSNWNMEIACGKERRDH